MFILDSHCHLDDRQYRKDFEQIINRARLAGVVKMLTVGIDPQTSEKAVSLAESHTGIYASVEEVHGKK
jgi:TatD DNase family protein